jgi:carbon-monoxide dehydrogenase medium subunit
MRKFGYHRPRDLEQALELLSRYGERAAVLAGGTDLLVEWKQKLKSPSHLIDIKGISSLEGILGESEGSLQIGPLTTLTALSLLPVLAEERNLLAQAACKVGSLQVRNRATLGGNICNASPSGDTLPALLCLDAKVEIASKRSERILPLGEFFLGPGLSALRPDELLVRILLPLPPAGSKGIYKKFSLKRAVDLAVVGVAVLALFDPSGQVLQDIRIALGAVAPTPIRAEKAEKLLRKSTVDGRTIKEAAQAAAEEARPISDLRASEWFRREMIFHLTEQALREIVGQGDQSA